MNLIVLIYDFLWEVFESVIRRATNAILTGIGIVWGVFILIVLLGFGQGLEKGISRMFKNFSKSTSYIYSSTTSLEYDGFPSGKQISFTSEDLSLLKYNISEIQSISPQVSQFCAVSYNSERSFFEVRGVYPSYFDMKLLSMEIGRVINPNDINNSRRVAIIGKNVADVLFGNEHPEGKELRIGTETFKVVGVIKNSLLNLQEERIVYIPFSSYSETITAVPTFSIVFFASKENQDINKIKQKIRNFMAKKYSFDPKDKHVLYFESMEDQVYAFNKLFKSVRSFIWFIGLSTLLSGIIGVNNIVYTSARERIREIGIRISIGAKPISIKAMFICESIAITTTFGMIGILLGWLFLIGIGRFISQDSILMENPTIDLSTTIAACMILLVSGIIAGVKPAIYASSLTPIDTLKDK